VRAYVAIGCVGANVANTDIIGTVARRVNRIDHKDVAVWSRAAVAAVLIDRVPLRVTIAIHITF
jgi:hypothetical protein